MRSPASAAGALVTCALLLASCAGGGGRMAGPGRLSDDRVRIGPPYTVGGRTYVPFDDRHYDEVGYASWYGGAHRGLATANGERFDPDGISAAHRTLPLPSYVEVTALDTGRTIIVRVNDRGPFRPGRIIDLSQGAARLLGIERIGQARVRVRRIEPGAADRAALLRGRPAAARADAPRPLLAALNARFAAATRAPAPESAAFVPTPPVPAAPNPLPSVPPPLAPAVPAVAARDASYVQVAALSDRGRAERLVTALGDIGTGEVLSTDGGLFRVRIGPFADDGSAASALAQARARGYQDARIVRDPAR